MSKRREDYLIGIVYSLEMELEATKLLLDEVHAMLPLDEPYQNNTLSDAYNCSKYHCNRVYDPVLPKYQVLLLVGIGSGIPSGSNDIRLGDVIVSEPSIEHGGAVQIHFRTRQKSWGTGKLDSPPSSLLRAVATLKALDELGRLNLSQDISKILADARNVNSYKFPGRHRDLLFFANYAHAQPGESCSSCDPFNLIPREDRDDHHKIVVHYGLIASSNSFFKVKDANLRDEIGTELNAICFYSGASRLINTLPCLVIRGVADYADTHESAEWQHYAALAASAYTKRLLAGIHMDTSRGIVAEASFDSHLSSAKHSDPGPHDGANTTADNGEAGMSIDIPVNTTLGNVTGIFAAKKIAQVMISNERLRPVCAIAALRLKRHKLQQRVSIALGVFSNALSQESRVSVLTGLGWLFNNYGSHIATDMTGIFYDREDLLSADRVETTPIPDSTLMQWLSSRFPAMNITNTAVNKARPGEVPTLDDQINMKTQEPSDDAILANLGRLDEILFQGPGFEDMLSKLKELLLPPVHILLENTLEECLAEPQGALEITCLVEWELLQLVKSEGLHVEDIDRLFTLSGDFQNARADPLADHEIWDTGKQLLETVKICLTMATKGVFDPVDTEHEAGDLAHQTRMQLSGTDMRYPKECAVVTIAGSAEYIKTILKQLAWLAATLRVPYGKQLTVSCINFQPQKTHRGETMEGAFRMSLWEQEKSPQPNDEPGQCWAKLFAQSVLAYGFPSSATNRPVTMRGLEIPFEVMASFAGIRFPLLLGKRLALASETHVLVPEIFSEHSIQWHFDTIKNALQRIRTTYNAPAPGMESVDLSTVHEYRAFLGYGRLSEVVMGTAEFCDVNITASRIGRTGHHLTFKHEGPFSAGTSIKGYFTANLGTTWKFKRGEMAQIEGSTISVDDVLKRSAETPALLYDDENCTAFLFSELSIVIQMAATYLRNKSDVAPDQIPRAYRSSDGGKAAYEAVKAAKNLEVHFGTGQPKKYPDIVREFIDQLEQRKKQRRANQISSEIALRQGLRGWSYTDVQEKRFEFWEREFPTQLFRFRPKWWRLFRDSNITILFAGGMPQPIRICHDQTISSCTSWDAIPVGHHLLLANVRDLQRLTSDVGDAGRKYPTRFMLTANLAWARPVDSRLFETDCIVGGRCNPLQTMCEPRSVWLLKALRSRNTAVFLPHPGRIESEGLVLFADDPSDIEDRPCQIVKHRQDVSEFQLRFIVGAILSPLFALMFCKFIITNYGELFVFFKSAGLGWLQMFQKIDETKSRAMPL